MHIRRLRIQNIRSITNLDVEIPDRARVGM